MKLQNSYSTHNNDQHYWLQQTAYKPHWVKQW